MTIESGTVADAPLASVAFSAKLAIARRRRRPVIAPFAGERQPSGSSEPPSSDQAMVPVPPVALSVSL